MPHYITASKRKIITGNPLGIGGEGEVFLINGSSEQVAKIYHTQHRTLARERKLEAMVANPPQDDTRQLRPPLCVYNK
jgi:DNA-binding helix-hairpin-helix protein with protein kinase domain